MKKLWAPWRMEYILNVDKEVGCLFCNAPKDKDDKRFILKRGKHSFIMLNLFPYNPGHLMVAPYRHVASFGDLTMDEIAEIGRFVQLCEEALKKEANPDGFNIGINIGRVAGAGFDGHIHVHIVPRWNGDTNFMPVLGETKVIPEGIRATYEKLKKYFEE